MTDDNEELPPDTLPTINNPSTDDPDWDFWVVEQDKIIKSHRTLRDAFLAEVFAISPRIVAVKLTGSLGEEGGWSCYFRVMIDYIDGWEFDGNFPEPGIDPDLDRIWDVLSAIPEERLKDFPMAIPGDDTDTYDRNGLVK